MTSDFEVPADGECYFCGEFLDSDFFCYGCEEFICAECDETEVIGYGHSPDEHAGDGEDF